jgi:NTP pyrophosphatase (non-canonical NTP hydrolase)
MNFWDEIVVFNDKYFPDWRNRHPMYYTNALAGEVGELCGITKRLAGGGTHYNEMPSKGQAIEECVDVLIYLTLFLESIMVNEEGFQSWFKTKMDILRQRMENRKIHKTEDQKDG